MSPEEIRIERELNKVYAAIDERQLQIDSNRKAKIDDQSYLDHIRNEFSKYTTLIQATLDETSSNRYQILYEVSRKCIAFRNRIRLPYLEQRLAEVEADIAADAPVLGQQELKYRQGELTSAEIRIFVKGQREQARRISERLKLVMEIEIFSAEPSPQA